MYSPAVLTLALEAIRSLGIAIIAFLVALIGTPFVLELLRRWGVKKQIKTSEAAPIFSALHAGKAGTPTMGGVLIWGTVALVALGFFAASSLWGGFFEYLNFIDREETYLPIAALLIAALVGLADDILGVLRIGPKGGGLSMRSRILVYMALGAVGAWWFYAPSKLGWSTLHVPFLGNFEIGIWYIPLFIFVIMASAFSANETDGLDGLLGGLSLFIFGALGVVSFALGRYDLTAMIGALIGALLAFLWYNIYPARFFMGDTGSMALGITMGVIAMLTNTTLLLPIFALPLVFETGSVIIQLASKKFLGRKVFLSSPIHHHFEALGMPESQITMRFWIVGAVCAGLGIILFFLDRFIGA